MIDSMTSFNFDSHNNKTTILKSREEKERERRHIQAIHEDILKKAQASHSKTFPQLLSSSSPSSPPPPSSPSPPPSSPPSCQDMKEILQTYQQNQMIRNKSKQTRMAHINSIVTYIQSLPPLQESYSIHDIKHHSTPCSDNNNNNQNNNNTPKSKSPQQHPDETHDNNNNNNNTFLLQKKMEEHVNQYCQDLKTQNKHAYEQAQQNYEHTLHLWKQKKEWWFVELPDHMHVDNDNIMGGTGTGTGTMADVRTYSKEWKCQGKEREASASATENAKASLFWYQLATANANANAKTQQQDSDVTNKEDTTTNESESDPTLQRLYARYKHASSQSNPHRHHHHHHHHHHHKHHHHHSHHSHSKRRPFKHKFQKSYEKDQWMSDIYCHVILKEMADYHHHHHHHHPRDHHDLYEKAATIIQARQRGNRIRMYMQQQQQQQQPPPPQQQQQTKTKKHKNNNNHNKHITRTEKITHALVSLVKELTGGEGDESNMVDLERIASVLTSQPSKSLQSSQIQLKLKPKQKLRPKQTITMIGHDRSNQDIPISSGVKKKEEEEEISIAEKSHLHRNTEPSPFTFTSTSTPQPCDKIIHPSSLYHSTVHEHQHPHQIQYLSAKPCTANDDNDDNDRNDDKDKSVVSIAHKSHFLPISHSHQMPTSMPTSMSMSTSMSVSKLHKAEKKSVGKDTPKNLARINRLPEKSNFQQQQQQQGVTDGSSLLNNVFPSYFNDDHSYFQIDEMNTTSNVLADPNTSNKDNKDIPSIPQRKGITTYTTATATKQTCLADVMNHFSKVAIQNKGFRMKQRFPYENSMSSYKVRRCFQTLLQNLNYIHDESLESFSMEQSSTDKFMLLLMHYSSQMKQTLLSTQLLLETVMRIVSFMSMNHHHKTTTTTMTQHSIKSPSPQLLLTPPEEEEEEDNMEHACVCLGKFLSRNDTVEINVMDLRNYLTDVEHFTSVNVSRATALHLGRQVERFASQKGISSGLEFVNRFIQEHRITRVPSPFQIQQNTKEEHYYVEYPIFRKWLASLKPKLDSNDLEHFLKEITILPEEAISMNQFVKIICLPQPPTGSSDSTVENLKKKIKAHYSSIHEDKIILNKKCYESDMKIFESLDKNKRLYLDWIDFVNGMDSTSILLTAGELNQLAQVLLVSRDGKTFEGGGERIHYTLLKKIIEGENTMHVNEMNRFTS